MNQNSNKETKRYRVILFLVIGLTALSSAIKELNQVRHMVIEAGEFVSRWSDVIMPTANARTPRAVENCTDKAAGEWQQKDDEFRWNGSVAQGQAIEIKGINGDITAESTTGGEVQLVAYKKARRSDVNSVELKVVQHAGGVTICALYPSDGEPNTCEPGPTRGWNSARNNDVRVNFVVRVPARVGFIGKTVNGEITATSLLGNVVTNTVNGGIKISTSGYAEAATVNGTILAKLGDTNWPSSLSFKTVNGGVTLDLPPNTSADVDAKTLNGSIVSEFPLNLTELKDRKHVKGKIGAGGRELVLKTLNGSINLRIGS
jgi:hypothetical protein